MTLITIVNHFCFSVLGVAAIFMCNATDQRKLPQNDKCKLTCPYQYIPHCAQNKDGIRETLLNKCELENINCLEDSSKWGRNYSVKNPF